MSRPAEVSATRRVVRSSTRTPSALLEIGNRAADGGLGHTERPGGGGEAVQIHDLREHRELGRGPDQAHGSLNPHFE